MTETKKNWSDEAVAQLRDLAGSESPVSAATVNAAAETLGRSARSVAAKLRQLDFTVASLAKEATATFTEDEGNALKAYIESVSGTKTYKEIAEAFQGGKFSPKQVQGKALALELTSHVLPAEKVEVARTYSADEEAKFVDMAAKGAFIEDIASALNKTIASVRGKALSLSRSGQITAIPKQKESHATAEADPVEVLGDKLSTMTVEQIAAAVGKTERGIKTLLTRRGLKAADYDGVAKAEKAAGRASKAAA